VFLSLTLKPDGGELLVTNFDSNSISSIETYNNEVGSTSLIGQHPSRGVVTADNSRFYVSNFGSDSVGVYDIDLGKMIATIAVGSHPDALALTPSQNYLLVVDTQAGDMTVIQKRTPSKKFEPGEYALMTLIPVGVQPNAIVVKSFVVSGAK
jgi:YVTN family beta-propeller protein